MRLSQQNIRGGGVGIYVSDSINFKRRVWTLRMLSRTWSIFGLRSTDVIAIVKCY